MDPFLSHISASLGRTFVPVSVPAPPVIDEYAARLVDVASDLTAVFVANATAAKIHVHPIEASAAVEKIVDHVRRDGHRSAVVTRSALFEQAGLLAALINAGIDARYWDESFLDATYDVDVGITDAWSAVAETGSIVVRSTAHHGRAVSLVPPAHVAVLERSQIVPDLIDLMRQIEAAGSGSGVVIITGPSKTADIEMNLVVGVHGPGTVDVFLI